MFMLLIFFFAEARPRTLLIIASGSWLNTLYAWFALLVWLKPEMRAYLFTWEDLDDYTGVRMSTSNKDFLVEILESSSSFGSVSSTFMFLLELLQVDFSNWTTLLFSIKWPGYVLENAKILLGNDSVSLRSKRTVNPYLTKEPWNHK